ncbi:LA2681 family HEPN domain-containing protein [Photobacterium phosphoreum]|uniref:LA2681 family HEPN domain-containing protein n=1 Tax=Photobacterium phosphoreum TaxID=659 RepID=UPI001960659A|nr:LA2681 family HEPN domain-containing protein [Photobacterium phosphoreum]
MSENMLNSNTLEELSLKADAFLIAHDNEKLKTFLQSLLDVDYKFENLVDEARFYYILGNCSLELFSYQKLDWFSDELSKSVIFFRKALYVIRKISFPTDEELFLQSCIETNLGNNLRSQGRTFCCISLWDNALKHSQNPVSIISKANNGLFLASNVYDPSHKHYHYFTSYQLINLGLERLEHLYPEQRIAYSNDSNFMIFKAWFEDNFKPEDFDYFESFEEEVETSKQGEYLKWCGDNKLFINDLNDVCVSEIVYQDIMTLPSFYQQINFALSMHEELMYHGNFDELKNDYCYARYLIFSAKDIPSDNEHFFNKTYPHVDDLSYSITNLKASHYKNAFRTLYSLFDKIAYFINRFFDLNDIEYDRKISFDSIFQDLNSSKNWKPHSKLKDSQNCFIHALFYILKDIRDVKCSTSISRWLDPDAKAFSDIRNAIEHRSLKIVEDFGYTLTQSDKNFRQSQLEELNSEIEDVEAQLQELYGEISLAKKTQNKTLKAELENKKQLLDENLRQAQSKIYEQKKLSSHSMLIKESEFESRLMTLMKLARNSIMYLSLAIHVEEQNKSDNGALIMPQEVPLK